MLLVALPGSVQCLLAVEFECLTQCDTQGFEELRFLPFLAVHAWHLFDPADPPLTFVLQHCGVGALHLLTSYKLLVGS